MPESISGSGVLTVVAELRRVRNCEVVSEVVRTGQRAVVIGLEVRCDTDVDEDVENDDDSCLRNGGTNGSGPSTPAKFPALPSFFAGKTFFLTGKSMDEERRRSLKRRIVAAEGKVSEYMAAEVNFIVTGDRWGSSFDDALEKHPKVKFVTPKYVEGCWKKKECLSYRDYAVRRK